MSIERLSAEDELTLRMDAMWPQDIGAIAILDGGALLDPAGHLRIDAARAAVESRLHLVPRFRQRLHRPRRGLGGPLWVDAADFDLREHVQVLPLPAGAGEAELLAATEHLRRQRLDPSRPLWEMWFLPGLPDGRVGLFVRLHHAVADGMAAIAAIGTFLDEAPAPVRQPSPWLPVPPPTLRALLAENVRRRAGSAVRVATALARPPATLRAVRSAWPATRELLLEAPSPATSLDRLVGRGRTFALVRSRIEDVKRVARTNHATVNDVLLAATAAGLRRLLATRGEPVEDLTLRVYVPVSLRRGERAAIEGNLISQMVVPLALGEAEPGSRLRVIAAETARRKARTRTSLGTLFRSRALSRLLLTAIKRQRVNVATANLRGPERALHLAGARVLEVFPVINLVGRVGLGIGALSYAGAFNIGVTADRDAYPDLDVFAAGMRDELRALGGEEDDAGLEAQRAAPPAAVPA